MGSKSSFYYFITFVAGNAFLLLDSWVVPIVEYYNYALPKMDQIFQNIVVSQRMSMLDGFLGYNQILVHPED